MVRRLIDSEPDRQAVADEAIAGLLARQDIHIARRTVAKYRGTARYATAPGNADALPYRGLGQADNGARTQ